VHHETTDRRTRLNGKALAAGRTSDGIDPRATDG